jgi:REP element-mobilizing transposase RayT
MSKDYVDFQDRNTPLAYFITFSCYGTWLHGDERGSKNRRKYNQVGEPNIPPTPKWAEHETPLLKNPPFKLNAARRPIVEKTIAEVCAYRGLLLYAVQARTNHVHSVVSAGVGPEKIMGAFKAYSTRHLREKKLVSADSKIWSRHGSTRYLWTEKHIELAIDYVLNCQGEKLPRFEVD